jgi:hypothetical protein
VSSYLASGFFSDTLMQLDRRMTSKAPEEILGLEFDWLASDADGHVALFSTAGGHLAFRNLRFSQQSEIPAALLRAREVAAR